MSNVARVSGFFNTFAAVKTWMFFILFISVAMHAVAQDLPEDSLSQMSEVQQQQKRRSAGRWLRDYFRGTYRKSGKPASWGILFGPSYKSTTSFSLGGGFTGAYSWDRSDTLLPKSSASIFFNASVTGMLRATVLGRNYMKHDRQRWDYELYVVNLPTDFWGIGYDNGVVDANKGSYRQFKVYFQPNYLFRLAHNLYLGPKLSIQHNHTFKFSDINMIEGQSPDATSVGVGLDFQYDSRDFSLNAYRGNFIRLEQLIYPKGLNSHDFFSTTLNYRAYRMFWKTGVVALDLYGQFNYGHDVPWTMYSQVGQNGRMRGYYEGRYRDRNILQGQLELRQRFAKKFGFVVWGGAANVFHDFNVIRMNQILPNYGAGLRWEFRKRMNIRFDVGFTRDKPGFEFGMNEAF